MENQKKTIGNIGEGLAARFLESKGYKIIERNHWRKWGEIDIVAVNDNVLHFVEVKTISNPNYSPEDNVRAWKKLRLSRVIRTYLLDNKVSDEQEFEIDVMAIRLDFGRKKARIRMIENVNLGL